jgi:hypothetical protein
MWLLKKLRPDFKTIADFRKDNKEAIKGVCKEFIVLCKNLNLFSGELVAIDGSKFKAVNSKKRNFNEAKLKKKIKEIENKIDEYLNELDEADRDERDIHSPDKEELRKKIEEIKRRKDEYNKLLEKLKESEETQISLTDADSRAMINNQRVEVCYNVQLAVDDKHKLIVDYEVSNAIKDDQQLSEMAKRAKEVLGVETLDVVADKGYYNSVEIKECVEHGITPYVPEPDSTIPDDVDIYHKEEFRYDAEPDVYRCPMGSELTYRNSAVHHGRKMRLYRSNNCRTCPMLTRCTRSKRGRTFYRWEHEWIPEEMRERVRKEKDKVKKQNILIEHIFGTMKRGFNQGYMLMRGKEKVTGEMSLTVLAYNIKRVLKIIGMERLKEAVSMVGRISETIFDTTRDTLLYNFRFFFGKFIYPKKYEFTFHTI